MGVLSGHSAGNHVTCSLLTGSCGNNKAKGVVMMDPVDGYDPIGIIKNYCTTPGEKLSFDVPALLLRTGLDPKVKYGHLDVNNGGVGKMGSIMCASDDEPNDVYQAHIAELVDSFLKTIFDEDSVSEAKLNDASWMKVDVELQNDYNGHSAPFKAGCTQKSVSV